MKQAMAYFWKGKHIGCLSKEEMTDAIAYLIDEVDRLSEILRARTRIIKR